MNSLCLLKVRLPKVILTKLMLTLALLSVSFTVTARNLPEGQVIRHTLTSVALADNLINLNSERQLRVYVPASYRRGHKRYPVVYHIYQSEPVLDQKETVNLLNAAIAGGRIGEFILVTADFRIPNSLNFFGNGPTTGRWLDFIAQELVPFIDQQYRTLPRPESRGISGHFLGGYAAIKLAMQRPDLFGSVYALHPVATSNGEKSFLYVPNWQEIHSAKSAADLKAPYSAPFVAMAQAHLPNPERPPFYADFIVEQVDGELAPNLAHIRKLKRNFHLADLLPDYAENLHQLRGIGFDWGRNDPNQAHVYGMRKFVVNLEDFGLKPEAVEHSGNSWDYGFEEHGHFSTRLLPFFARHLSFGK